MNKRPIVWIGLIFLLISLFLSASVPSAGNELPEELSGSLTGFITQIEEKEGKTTLLLTATSFYKEGEDAKHSLDKVLVHIKSAADVAIGNQVLVRGDLFAIQKPTNPGEFNAFYYYNSKGIHYRMVDATLVFVQPTKDNWRDGLYRFRRQIKKGYESLLSKESSAILSAMFLGDDTALSPDTKRLYQKSGMAHLLAISGLHVSLLGFFVYQMTLRIFRHKRLAILLAVGTLVSYGVMTGFSISTNRAVMMLFVYFLGILIGRTYDMLSAAVLAAIAILAVHPYEVRNSGFLLSFGAIFAIAILYPQFLEHFIHPLPKPYQKIISMILLSVSIQIVTFPILISSYYEYPIYGMLINLIAIPALSVLAVAAILMGLLSLLPGGLGALLVGGVEAILFLYRFLANLATHLPGALLITGKPHPFYLFFYYTILIICYLCVAKWKKKWMWLLFLIVFLVPMHGKNPGMQVTFLDVGQGDGIFISSKEGVSILVDTGSSTKRDVGCYVLEPFLKASGCRKLDYVIITHLDTDHYNGILELIEFTQTGGIPIGAVILPKAIKEDESFLALTKLLIKNKIPLIKVKRGDTLTKGVLSFFCVNPGEGAVLDKNDASLGLSVSYGNFSMLLTGDMEESERQAMQYLTISSYKLLKVGHHGSKSSSCAEFLERVSPSVAIISAGRNNRYGHPHKETLERLETVGARIYQTSKSGAITVTTDGEAYQIETFLE